MKELGPAFLDTNISKALSKVIQVNGTIAKAEHTLAQVGERRLGFTLALKERVSRRSDYKAKVDTSALTPPHPPPRCTALLTAAPPGP